VEELDPLAVRPHRGLADRFEPSGDQVGPLCGEIKILGVGAGWQVREHELHSKSKNTPFDYRPVQGRVLLTVVDGRRVFALNG
jgi:dihydroorotase